jgi:hypothetical protein
MNGKIHQESQKAGYRKNTNNRQALSHYVHLLSYYGNPATLILSMVVMILDPLRTETRHTRESLH